MTVLATTAPDDQDLAVFDASLQLGDSEPLSVGVKRVTMEQLEKAVGGYFTARSSIGPAVHESRKAVKRVRALLRLVRGELPDRIYEFENRSLRETSRLVAGVRASQGVLDAAESIQRIYGDLLADGTFEEMRLRLTRRRDLAEVQTADDPNTLGRVVRGLERAHHRFASWPTDPEARQVYGMGIRDTYSAMAPGLGRSYDLGRHRMVTAYRRGGPGDFHEWRKRVKDMRHQMEFLAPLWPEVVVGTAMTLERLGNVLGDDNDLAELSILLSSRPDLCPEPRERSLFRALAGQRRSELQLAAEILGRRVYAEKPRSLSSRFAEYWEARKIAATGSLETISVS
ncbi:MAG TPA: CHAD domain-containing protein [Acidimicrobiia bacterium]|nr:CHAD domain-containing protein [Acidimicrobiia bacterium]